VFQHRSKMLSRLLALTVVVAAALAVAPASQARAPRDFVGLSADDVFGPRTGTAAGDEAYRLSNLSAIRAAHGRLLRKVFDWSEIERSPGHYDLGVYDRYVADAASRGIKILPVLFNPPSFRARGHGGHGTWPPASNPAFAAFAKVLVHRYGRHGSLWTSRRDIPKQPITSWQIWNEPSLTVYWLPRPNARQYVRMLKVVGKAIKSVDGRRAEIVTAGIPPSLLSSAVPILRYIRQLYRAGGKRYFDTLAVNSYARNRSELGGLLRSVRRLMNRYGDRRAKLWITELGWATGGPTHRFNVGPVGQARRISSCFSLIRRLRGPYRIRGLVYFSWKDQRPYPPLFSDLWGLHTGLRSLDGRAKPGYFAFKRAAARFR
jgi:hypothetical protein